MTPRVNDEWEASFEVLEISEYCYMARAWLDHFDTWQVDLKKNTKLSRRSRWI